jgi:hypothetical protein
MTCRNFFFEARRLTTHQQAPRPFEKSKQATRPQNPGKVSNRQNPHLGNRTPADPKRQKSRKLSRIPRATQPRITAQTSKTTTPQGTARKVKAKQPDNKGGADFSLFYTRIALWAPLRPLDCDSFTLWASWDLELGWGVRWALHCPSTPPFL